jgi:thioredoxin-related protein
MGEGKKLAREYEAARNPTFVVLEANGTLVGKWSGYEKDDFIKSLNDLLTTRNATPLE